MSPSLPPQLFYTLSTAAPPHPTASRYQITWPFYLYQQCSVLIITKGINEWLLELFLPLWSSESGTQKSSRNTEWLKISGFNFCTKTFSKYWEKKNANLFTHTHFLNQHCVLSNKTWNYVEYKHFWMGQPLWSSVVSVLWSRPIVLTAGAENYLLHEHGMGTPGCSAIPLPNLKS